MITDEAGRAWWGTEMKGDETTRPAEICWGADVVNEACFLFSLDATGMRPIVLLAFQW